MLEQNEEPDKSKCLCSFEDEHDISEIITTRRGRPLTSATPITVQRVPVEVKGNVSGSPRASIEAYK